MSDSDEVKMKNVLAKSFKDIGKAQTKYTKKMSNVETVNKYLAKIMSASALSQDDSNAKNHLEKMQQRSEQAEKANIEQYNIMFGGSGKFLSFIVEPFTSCIPQLYRGERIVHNVLKLVIAIALVAATTLAIIYLPVFSVPFLAFVATLFGKTAMLTAGVVGVGVAFKVAEGVLDLTQPVPDHVLRVWKKHTALDYDVVNVMQQYLVNFEKASQLRAIKNLIDSLKKAEMRYPTPESLQKLGIFFSKQLLKLQKEKEMLELQKKQETLLKGGLPSEETEKKLTQVKLDIIAVIFILKELLTVTHMPMQAKKIIAERLPKPQDKNAHKMRKERRRTPEPKSVQPVSFLTRPRPPVNPKVPESDSRRLRSQRKLKPVGFNNRPIDN